MKEFNLESIRNKVLILTNGRRSEKNYFELIKSNYSSPYEINIKFMKGAPKYLAQYAIGLKDGYNKIFIVVDVDQFDSNILETETLLKLHKNTIYLILSNISFEVWLVNHYKQFSSHKTVNELIDDIDEYLKSQGSKTKYAKNDKDTIEKYFINNMTIAAKNTKLLYQRLLRDYNIVNRKPPRIIDLISSSTMYRVVEELKLIKKD